MGFIPTLMARFPELTKNHFITAGRRGINGRVPGSLIPRPIGIRSRVTAVKGRFCMFVDGY
jgi:hypothetical protein